MKLEMMKNITSLLFTVLAVASLHSCSNDVPAPAKTTDTTRFEGIYGHIKMYNEYGEETQDYQDLDINLYLWTDTLKKQLNGGEKPMDIEGDKYSLRYSSLLAEGYMRITMESKSLGYSYYENPNIQYDAKSEDSLETVIISKAPPANINIDSAIWSKDSTLVYIYRTINFTGRAEAYSVASRYFMGKTEAVNSTNYKYQFLSGSVKGSGGSSNYMEVVHGISKKDTLRYITAYCDNYRPTSYLDTKGKEVFTSLAKQSSVVYITASKAK